MIHILLTRLSKIKKMSKIVTKITDVKLEPLASSIYIRPMRMHFKQDGKPRSWDILRVHDSVQIMLYHKDHRALVFVKQFRPSVYLANVPVDSNGTYDSVDWEKYPASLGYTLELCAGIIDKQKSIIEIAQEEVLEECGYQVPLSKLEKVTSYRTGVGATGAMGTLFYAEIDETMKVTEGGGNQLEGEQIDLEYIPVENAKHKLLHDENIQRPTGVLFSVYWFFENKWPLVGKL